MPEKKFESDADTTREIPEIGINVSYSMETEVSRIKNTLRDLSWYREQGYRLRLPHELNESIEKNSDISDDDIHNAIEHETSDPDIYQKQVENFTTAWETEKEHFLKQLRNLGLPLPNIYTVYLTRYGGGGSYDRPNTLVVNTDPPSGSTPIRVAIHEIVHITIEDLIQKYQIKHWVKERLVDLIMNKFYPEQERFQRDLEDAQAINDIFERNYPHIETIIKEVSELHQ